jgi:hypothetical protein
MRKLKVLFLLPLIFLCGCSDPYGASVKAGATIAASITQGMNTVAQLETQGLMTPTEAGNVLGYLEFANKQDEAFINCATAAHTAGGVKGSYTACTTGFAATLSNPQELALIHVVNPTAQTNVETIANAISAGVAAINAALGGA